MRMTAKTVQRTYPDGSLRVQLASGEIKTGSVRGYFLPYARIFVNDCPGGFEASWETVAACVDGKRPLKR